ncbi:MAG: hypothetical protein AAFQ37_08960 [Bacteroidota bacterium]
MELLKFIKGVAEAVFGFFYELLTLDWSFANHEIVYSIVGLGIALLLLKQLIVEFIKLGPMVVSKGFGHLANYLALGMGNFFRSLLKIPSRLIGRSFKAVQEKLIIPGIERARQMVLSLWYRLPFRHLQWPRKRASSRDFYYFLNTYQRWKFAWKERIDNARARLWYRNRFQ